MKKNKIFIEKAKKVHGDKYDYSKIEYINNRTKIIIICPKHGEFKQTPNKHLFGQGCPKCVGRGCSFLSFDEARFFGRSLNFKLQKEWIEYCKSGNKPDNIPSNPDYLYKEDWINWGDWLGTKIGFNGFLSFDEARKIIHSLNLKTQKEWQEYCKSGNRPDNIPSIPNRTYKNVGWVDWGDWLGTNTIAPQNKVFLSFYDARTFARSLNLKLKIEWDEYSKSGKKPDNIPSGPSSTYKKDWINWGDWLGTKIGFDGWVSFEDARKFAQKQNLKSKYEWKVFKKSEFFPIDIPKNPNVTYKDNGWINWGDFLGTFTLAPKNISKNYLSEEEAKQFLIAKFSDVHPDDMDDVYEKWWNENKPNNLPKYLKSHYKLFYND